MSDSSSTLRCSNCKRNRPSSVFSHPSRAAPYKTCCDCRSKGRSGYRRSKNPFPQIQEPVTTINENNDGLLHIEPGAVTDIGAFEIEEPRRFGDIIGEECPTHDDPVIFHSQRETPEFASHLETQRLLADGDGNEQPNEERIGAAQSGHEQQTIDTDEGMFYQEIEDISKADQTIDPNGILPRRLPQWLSTHGHRRSLPAGYVSRYNRQMLAHDLGDRTSRCSFCHALHWVQERVHGSSIRSPRFQTCCKEGEVILQPVPEPPQELRRLWTSEERDAKEFRRNSRKYNRAFAFTSFNFTPDRRLEQIGLRGGLQSFSIHGEIFHQTAGIRRQGVTPSYAQLYFLDPDLANEERTMQSRLNPGLVEEISSIIEQTNPFVQYYRTALDSLISSNQEQVQRVILNPRCELVLEGGTDRRRYNLPTVREFALLIPDEVNSDNRDVILFTRNGDGSISDKFHYIHRSHPAYLPLHYVLFYPYGNPGYRWSLPLAVRSNRVMGNLEDFNEDRYNENRCGSVSARQFYRYHLFTRQNPLTLQIQFNAFIHGERLFQQLCCDMYACVDDSILNWHRLNQDTIRSDLYAGVIDALRTDHAGQNIGKPVILASSYHGGDRFMTKCYQNAMAIVRALGKPALFITITANPYWPEIVRQLEHSQTPDTRPDLISIVFKLKLDALLHDLKQKHAFGKCIGDTYTIEYQKRGLPHAHLLLFLHQDDVPRSAELVDELVRAQIPTDDPALAAIVQSQLTHGPCGRDYPNAPCMRDGKCSKGFPKRWCEETVLADDSYPEYARPNNGVTWVKNGFTFDNRWVVPYNPYLTKKYAAHINVEIARGVHAIKYLAKYVYKGSDRASLAIQDRYDEISMTIQGRYISSAQAIWRLNAYTTHEEKPAVMLLPYHLEGRHQVSFRAKLTSQQIAAAVETQSSVFLDWMDYNSKNADGRDLLYSDFPLFYTHTKKKGWQMRKKGHTIGRMPIAVPIQGEHFYLRSLLIIKRGAKSYRDLYTIGGVTYDCPSAACRAVGLLFDDSDWITLFDEIKDSSLASSLRQTFAIALSNSFINNPQQIWDRFKTAFSDDCPWRLRTDRNSFNPPPSDWSDEQCRYDLGLWLLGDDLRHMNIDWERARLTEPAHEWTVRHGNVLLEDALNFDRDVEQEFLDESIEAFSSGQRAAYDEIVNVISNNLRPNTFFLQGPAGTGKTYLYKALCSHYRAQGKIVLCVASSGIASLLLPNGRTSHSQFRIPVECTDNSRCNINAQSNLASLIKQTSLIIWDEVTLQNKHNFAAVDKTLRDIMNVKDEMFGGIPVLLGGDFAQILPVVRRGQKEQTINACIKYWQNWSRIRQLFLTENMRVVLGELNQRFANWLSALSYTPSLYGVITLPSWIRTTDDREFFREFVYPTHQLQNRDESIFRDRAILTSRNDNVSRFNNEILQLVNVDSRDYFAADQVQNDESGHISDYPPEFIQSITGRGLPDGKITLQVGMPVMLIRNYYAKQGLCNGTRLIITRLYSNCVKAKIISKDPRYDGQEHIISRMTLSSNEDLPFTLTRKQLPLRCCYSMTINKSQGQTLECVGVDLSVPVFAHGQFYVALSRVTNIDRLIVLLPNGNRQTKNIVYSEVLVRPITN